MFFLRQVIPAAVAAVFFGGVQGAEPAERQFAEIAQLSPQGIQAKVGQGIELDIDLPPGSLSVEVEGERVELRYRMAFNQIAEGWSWRPLADPAVDDYYLYKFLPLQSVAVERGEYEHEDKIGEPQRMRILWRYDYFLGFANLYDFYPRRVDDDAGFSASLPASLDGHVGMRAKAYLIAPVISESTTFWKATYARPTDLTLKKRYLVGHLDEIHFVDTRSGEVLCRIRRGQGHCPGQDASGQR